MSKVWRYHWYMTKEEDARRSEENKNDIEWGTLLVDNDGCIAILGDYENGTAKIHFNQGYWKDGRDFRTELLRANADYLTEKMFFSTGRELDLKATIEAIRSHINTELLGDETEEDERQNLVDLIESESFDSWYQATSIDDAQEFRCMKYNCGVIATRDFLWPQFKRLIREELAAEKALQPCEVTA